MSHIKHPVFIITIILALLLGGGAYYFWGRIQAPHNTVAVVQRTNLTEQVLATGRVKAAQDLTLAFEKPGKIARVQAPVGTTVKAGDILITLDSTTAAAARAQADANLKVQQAKLDELKKGARPEDIAVSQTQLNAAEQSASDLASAMQDSLQSAYTTADDAIRNKADQMFSNPRSTNPQINFSTTNGNALNSQRVIIESLLVSWQASLASPAVEPITAANAVKSNLQSIANFLDMLSTGVNALTSTSQMSQTTIDGWKLAVSTARTNINTSITGISSLVASLNSAHANVSLAENQLQLKKAGATPEMLAAQSAAVDSAKANLDAADADLAKTVLRAPLDGTITKNDSQLGEIVSPNIPVISMISASNFEIESYVSESDIAKIKTGATALVTLDAYGSGVQFPATVSLVDPAATIVNDVPSYRIVVQFSENDPRVKEGMTANIAVITATRTGVLAVPATALIRRGSDYIVLIQNNDGSTREQVIRIGIRDAKNTVEVTSGLNEGDRVVSFGQ